jgi:AraC-like DNA-binding protein
MTELVEKPERGLTEVAGDAGFFDYPHFSREFKRLALTTPRGFRLEPQYREYQLVAKEPGRA